MAKSLNDYKNLSRQLEKEIKICESSYEGFEKAVDLDALASNKIEFGELSEEQQEIYYKFKEFCINEGFHKSGAVTKTKYQKIKSSIEDRVKFLKEQKQNYDRMISLKDDLERLKNRGVLSAEEIKLAEEAAGGNAIIGTEAYINEVEKQKKILKKQKIEKIKNESLPKAEEKIKASKKENGIGKVITSAFGPIGTKIYNAYTKVQNANVDLRKKRVLNLIVKAGLGLGVMTLFTSLSVIGIPQLVGLGAIGLMVANTFRKIPEKKKPKEATHTLKESWFRFRKSHKGDKEIKTSKELYEGIDFSKYETKKEDKEEKASEDKKGAKKTENNYEFYNGIKGILQLKNKFNERFGVTFDNFEDAKNAIYNFLGVVKDYNDGLLFKNLEMNDAAKVTNSLFSFVNAYVYFNGTNEANKTIMVEGKEMKVGEFCQQIMKSGMPKKMLKTVRDYLNFLNSIDEEKEVEEPMPIVEEGPRRGK